MLKITYMQDNYHYDCGSQPYDIKTEIDIIEDASMTEALEAFLKALKIATYHVTRASITGAVEEIFDELGE